MEEGTPYIPEPPMSVVEDAYGNQTITHPSGLVTYAAIAERKAVLASDLQVARQAVTSITQRIETLPSADRDELLSVHAAVLSGK